MEPSSRISPTRGRSGGSQARRARKLAAAAARPSAPPLTARTSPSARNWRRSRPRPAPSAVRIATSRERALARASRRLATFTQAIPKHEAHGREQHQERRPGAADEAFGQGHEPHAPSLVLLRIGAGERQLDRRELGLGAGDRCAGREPPHDLQVVTGPARGQVAEDGVVRQRQPELGGRRVRRRFEGRGHHADDRAGLLVEQDRFSDDRGIRVKPRPPDPLAQHRDRRSSRVVVGGRQRASEQRR